jgi:sulfotransferase family protein
MRVFANSVQKSGTHLLLRLLALLGVPRYPRWRIDPEWTEERSVARRLLMRPPGLGNPVPIGRGVTVSSWWIERLLRRMDDPSALLGHCSHSREMSDLLLAAGVKTLCIIRDPRDVTVSYAHFVMKIGKGRILRKPEHQALLAMPDHGRRLLAMIEGHPGTPSVPDRYRAFLGWRDHPDVCFVRFEDLVGGAGGGDDDRQRGEIARVAKFLGLDADANSIETARATVFGNTSTFRKGTTGQWREEYGPEHLAAAHAAMDELLVDLEYETGTDW